MALCSICKTSEIDPATRPFCSRRCADVDLQRWLTGAYVIPGPEDEPSVAEDAADQENRWTSADSLAYRPRSRP